MKKFSALLLALVMLVSLASITIQAETINGLQVVDISSYDDLVSKLSTTEAKYYRLKNDISFHGQTPSSRQSTGDTKDTKHGAFQIYEGSVLDGQGYSFTDLNDSNLAGLFSIVQNNKTKATEFKNLTVGTASSPATVAWAVMFYNQQNLVVKVDNIHINVSTKAENSNNHSAFCSDTTSGEFTFTNCSANIIAADTSKSYGATFGAFVARNAGEVLLESCTVSGDIVAANIAGGFIGKSDGGKHVEIRNCTNTANVTSAQYTSGFVANITQANNIISINNSVNKGTITNTGTSNTYAAGGFVGGEQKYKTSDETTVAPNAEVNIAHSSNEGNIVLTSAASAGGFVGKTWGRINIHDCVNYGDVGGTNGNQVAGFVSGDVACNEVKIQNSLNVGNITSATWASGFCSQTNKIYISDCINIGTVIGDIWSSGSRASNFISQGDNFEKLSNCLAFGRIIDKDAPTAISYNLMGIGMDNSPSDASYSGNYRIKGGTYVDGTFVAEEINIDDIDSYIAKTRFNCLKFKVTDGIITCTPSSTGAAFVAWQMALSGNSVRIIGVVDSLDYSAVGFDYTVKAKNGQQLAKGTYTVSTVYSCITADRKECRPIHLGGRYIYMITLNNVVVDDVIEISAFSVSGGQKSSSPASSFTVENASVQLDEREGWSITGFPAYMEGELYQGVYYQTVGYQTLTSDEENYSMQFVSSTSAQEFKAYIDILKNDYKFDVDVTTDSSSIISFWVTNNSNARMYAYYTESTSEARFILDRESTTRKEFSDSYTKQYGDAAAVYLYGLAMDPDGENNTSLTEAHIVPDNNNFYASNCGQSMVIKLYDNSVIIIDGGGYVQMSKMAADKLDAFLHKITGTNIGDKVNIRAWILTHPHGDHYQGFMRFMVNYHQNYNLQSVMYNLRNCPDEDLKPLLGLKGGYLKEYYPDITYHRLHTGDVLNLGGVRFDIMYTFEDVMRTTSAGQFIAGASDTQSDFDTNDTSAVFKVTIDGKTFLITGDIYTDAERVLLRNYTNGELKSDVLQVPHHSLNYLPNFFDAVDADIALFTQSRGGVQALETIGYGNVFSYFKNRIGLDNMYFADGDYDASGNVISVANSGTVGVSVVDGQLKTEVLHEYSDHTPYPKDADKQWTQFDTFKATE